MEWLALMGTEICSNKRRDKSDGLKVKEFLVNQFRKLLGTLKVIVVMIFQKVDTFVKLTQSKCRPYFLM